MEYTIIPALTLISSSLMLLNNIVGRLYLIIIKCKNYSIPINNPDTYNQIERDIIF